MEIGMLWHQVNGKILIGPAQQVIFAAKTNVDRPAKEMTVESRLFIR
jgi:hypothetical protein